ncbi:HAD family hydrolase [Gynurincola endophyticus]|uniref:HAD family hydrolase n=1 Tax=Gynurincola endophyticus TaxID=2479004 RepID=UPI001315589F|nr:HAD family hydrolase [Gynurincola endophyticus]
MRKIAFFDFDGTITTKDTFVEVIKYAKGKFRCYLGFAFLSPYIVGFKLKIISNQRAKERVLRWFFRKMPQQQFENICQGFAEEYLPTLLRPKAIVEIDALIGEGTEVVIVSASPQDWIIPWAQERNIPVLASRLAYKDLRVTGKLIGKNCRGTEKVKRIVAQYNLDDYDEIYAYGDTSGDTQMLSIADKKFYKPFR